MKTSSFNRVIIYLSWLPLLLSCNRQLLDSETRTISMGGSGSVKSLSSLISVTGFTPVESNNDQFTIRNYRKILFSQGKVIFIDNKTDFQHIWVFNEPDGKFLGQIGRQDKSDNEAFFGMNNAALMDHGDGICCLSSAKMSFVNYGLSGNFVSNLANGVFGDDLVVDGGGYVVYNEFNPSEVSGNYHLLFYDKKGNLVKRMFPYNPSSNFMGYEYTGFLKKSDNRIWFSPPFCDTIFEVTRYHVTPRYSFLFNPGTKYRDDRQKSGINGLSSSCIGEQFAKVNNFLFFDFTEDNRINIGAYDEWSGQLLKFRDAEKDYLYSLLQIGEIYPKDFNTFCLVLKPSRVLYLVKKGLLNEEEISKHIPGLLECLRNIQENSNPVLLYCTIHTGATLSAAGK